VIKKTIRDVVAHVGQDALSLIQQHVAHEVNESDRENVQALIVEELRRMHEGVLARYGLRPSEFVAWKSGRTMRG
jgi:hypothetical protein